MAVIAAVFALVIQRHLNVHDAGAVGTLTAPAESSESPSIARLENLTRRLEGNARRSERRLAELEQAAAYDEEVPATKEPDEVSILAALPPEERTRAIVQITSKVLDEELKARSYDSESTAETNAIVAKTLLRDEFAGTKLADVHCADDLCRVRMEHDDRNAWVTFLENGIDSSAFRGSMFFNYDTDKGASTFYVAPMGAKLPAPDRERMLAETALLD